MAAERFLSTIDIVRWARPTTPQTLAQLWNAAGAAIELHGIMVSSSAAGTIALYAGGVLLVPAIDLAASDHEDIEFVHPLILTADASLQYTSTINGAHSVMAWGEFVGATTSTSTTTTLSTSTSTSSSTTTSLSTSTSTTTSTTTSLSTSTSTTTSTSSSTSTSTTTSTTTSLSTSTSTTISTSTSTSSSTSTTISTSTSTSTSSSTTTSTSTSTTTAISPLVTSSASDAWIDRTDLEIDLDSTYLAFGRGDPEGDANPCDVGVRFVSVLIPQGATIHSAYVTGYASDTVSGATATAVIRGEDADTANAFSTYANFIARIKTSASVAWASIAAWTFGTAYATPSLTSIIQEIVNRASWVSGNAIVIFIENNGSSSGAYREWAAYDHLTLAAPQLVVTFS